jgi:hypothetical protein
MKSNSPLLRHLSTATIALTFAPVAWSSLSGPAMAAVLAPAEGEEAGPKIWPVDATKHVVVIKRDAADTKQTAMITAAEAAQANKEVLRVAVEAHNPNNPVDPAQAKRAKVPEGDNVWWHQEQLGIRIPCAVTADAILYYTDLVTKNATKEFKNYAMPSSRLDYHAIAQFHKEFKVNDKTFANVNVVTLVLIFSANFTAEATSGMQFEKIRIVILDAANKVLHISGDGPTEVPIMML